MSLEGRLESVVQDGDEVVLTYRESDTTSTVRRLQLSEFERQFGMLSLFNKNKEPITVDPAKDDPEIDTLQELANFRQEVLEDLKKRAALLQASYDSLKDFITTTLVQREKLASGLNDSTGKSLASVAMLLEQAKEAQNKALETIIGRDQTIRAIMSDLETRKEWTWDNARRVQREVELSNAALAEFKAKTEKQIIDMNVALTAKMNSFDGMLAKLQTDKDIMIKGVVSDAERLIAQYRTALDDKSEMLKLAQVDSYKQSYLESELVRRTAMETEKAGIAQRQFDAFQKKIEDRLGAIRVALAEQDKKLDAAFEGPVDSVRSILKEETFADIQKAIDKETIEVEGLKAKLNECESKAVKVRELLSIFTKTLQEAPEETFDLVEQLDARSKVWAEKIALLETELKKRGALKELTKVEVVETPEEKKGFFKRLIGK